MEKQIVDNRTLFQKIDDFCFAIWSWFWRTYRWLRHLRKCDERYMTQPDPVRYCRYCMRMRFANEEIKKKFDMVKTMIPEQRSIEKLSRDRQARYPDSNNNQSNNK